MNTKTFGDNNLFGKSILLKQFPGCKTSTRGLCSGKKCKRMAKNLLMISFIKKTGYFCDECTHDLLTAELAERVSEMLRK
jgi:hypothetical protein